MLIVFLLMALLVAVATVVFAIQNPGVIEITLIAWTVETSLTVVVMIAFALGLIATALILLPGMIKSRVREGKHKKTIKDMKDSLPADDDDGAK